MCAAFETWRATTTDRQALITAQLDRILATPGLSRDMTEMVGRIRGTDRTAPAGGSFSPGLSDSPASSQLPKFWAECPALS